MVYFWPQKRYTKEQKGKISTGVLLLAGILILALVYLWQINSLVQQGYQIEEAKKQLNQLRAQNQELQIQATQLQSLEILEQATESLNLIEAGKVSYLREIEETVVVKP